MRPVPVPVDHPDLAPARARLAMPLAATGPEAAAAGTSVHTWDELVDPRSGLLDRVASDWARRGGFDDDRRPWVLTVFGLAHQVTHASVAYLLLTERVLDLAGLRVRLRHGDAGTARAAGLVLADPAPAWTGTRPELVTCWWKQVRMAMEPLVERAATHGVREQVGWGEPVGLATVACHTLGAAGVPGARELAEQLAAATGRPGLTAIEDDQYGDAPGWQARRTTCCQWWQSQHDAHYCLECPLHRSPRAAVDPLPVEH